MYSLQQLRPVGSLIAPLKPLRNLCNSIHLSRTATLASRFRLRKASITKSASLARKQLLVSARLSPGNSGNAPERALKTTVELDRFIDTLKDTEASQLPQLVAEHVLAFDTSFWLRLATRAESCGSPSAQRELEDLASTVMRLVDSLVRRTQEKIDLSADVLSNLLKGLAEKDGEIVWPPRDPGKLDELREAIDKRELQGELDDAFLSHLTAQLRQATEQTSRPGLTLLLQRVLQMYASVILSRRSYQIRPDGTVDEAEKLLEAIIAAPEEQWECLTRENLLNGGGKVVDQDLFDALNKRMERMFMRTEGGSYQQRVLGEFLREIEARARAVSTAFRSPPPAISM